MALWLSFAKGFPLENFIKETAAQGLYLESTRFCSSYTSNTNSLRFGFASLTEKELERSVDIMVRASAKIALKQHAAKKPDSSLMVN